MPQMSSMLWAVLSVSFFFLLVFCFLVLYYKVEVVLLGEELKFRVVKLKLVF